MSSAAFTGLAVLENPRLIPKSKTIVFDLQAALPSSEPAIIGSIRYFNADNLEFPEIGCYAVWLSVARTVPNVEVFSEALTPKNYHIIGDAVWLILLGDPDNFRLTTPAFVQVCGVGINMNEEDATFDIVAEQYITATGHREGFPVHCLIPHTKRFEKYKPIPGKGKYVSVTGFLDGIERNDDDDKTIKHFIITIDQVVFLGQSASAPKLADQSPTKLATGTPAGLKFTGFLGSQDTDMKSGEPKTKKRKTTHDRAAEETDDKGEGTSAQGSRNTRSSH